MVKLRDSAPVPSDDDLPDKLFDEMNIGSRRQLGERFPGASIHRVFTALEPERLRQLVDEARRRDRSYRPPNFLAYYIIDSPNVDDLIDHVRSWPAVERAYIDTSAGDPAVTPEKEPRRPDQGYLDPAPDGIDAEFAWTCPGGDGQGQDFVDLEQGWTLEHKELIKHNIALLHGMVLDDARPHGTSVLAEVCAVDNTAGCAGIAPNVGSVNVVSYEGSTRPNAILAAIDHLPYGGVLLLEAQLLAVTVGTTVWRPLPLEALDAEFDAIRLATALGITVIEAAGNGGTDLDTFENGAGELVLKRDAVRDSGAIMVGAASSTAPHSRRCESNYGSRVDCYAWGEDVDTATSTTVAPFSTTYYTGSFDGTSSAAAIIAGAALVLQGIAEASPGGYRLSPLRMRGLLSSPATGTPSSAPSADRIGVMPNLRCIIQSSAMGVVPDVSTPIKPSRSRPSDKRG